jgi:hypothetical protein
MFLDIPKAVSISIWVDGLSLLSMLHRRKTSAIIAAMNGTKVIEMHFPSMMMLMMFY